MKTITNSKQLTTLKVGDRVKFGDITYQVESYGSNLLITEGYVYFLGTMTNNGIIFNKLNLDKSDFINKLGIEALCCCDFPETKSLEALTAIVSALYKEYEKQNELPKTWEEFCKRNPLRDEERYITSRSGIEKIYDNDERNEIYDKNICTSKQEAEAFLALMQLRQLRKAYVGDWEPDWMSATEPKYCVHAQANNFSVQCWYQIHYPLSFPKCELATQFLTNFKDLIEIAKPLL